MGMDWYIVSYKYADIPRGYDFWEKLEKEFSNYDNNNNIYIEQDRFEEWLQENPEMKKKFLEHIKRVLELLKEKEGCLELNYC